MERAGFSEAPEIGPPTSDARAIVPPIDDRSSPDGHASVGHHRQDHREERPRHEELPDERLGVGSGRRRRAETRNVTE